MKPSKPLFFARPAEFRDWLFHNHQTVPELWVGFYKKASGRPSITWPESVDQALCFGWIDGIRKSVDDVSYVIRFTPRRKNSVWSDINTKRVRALIAAGQVEPAGLRAFRARRANKSGIYSYEQRPKDLEPRFRNILKRDKRAWKFFQAQSPSYRRMVSWWVVSAKKEETRLKRLQSLLKNCANEKRLF